MKFYKLHKKRGEGPRRGELSELGTPEKLKPLSPSPLETGYYLILGGFRDIFGSVSSPDPLLVLKKTYLIFT